MPAYFDCGFSVRTPAWHGLGMVLEDYPEDWDDARRAAGLMWEPTSVPVYVASPSSGIGNVKADGFQGIARDDTGELLHVATDSYSVITHAQMGELIDAVMGADSKVKFETAGSCRDGRQVWALVRLDEPYEVAGDDSPTYPFLALLNAHDGSAACSLTYTDVRVVCWNTWTAADAQGKAQGTRHVIRHTGNMDERIAEAKKAIAGMRAASAATRQLFEQLAQVPVRSGQVKTFTELFLPSPRDVGEQCSDRVHANVTAARAKFTELHDSALTTEGIRGSAYGLLQASTEYLDHVRGFRNRDSYLGRTILRPEQLKYRALGLIEDVLASAN